MVWAGSPFSTLIEFNAGPPTSDISYTLVDQGGTVLIDDSLSIVTGALSALLTIPGSSNSCALPLFETRTLTWEYSTSEGTPSGRVTYRVDRVLPVPVTPDGVRAKLGVEPHELDDNEINLLRAYGEFMVLLPSADLNAIAAAGDYTALVCFDAIEALAALSCLPSLELKIAQSESSETNKFSRYTSVDWAALRAALSGMVDQARALLDPEFDDGGLGISMFALASRATDAITGE